VPVPRYRGVELPFYHIFSEVHGVLVDSSRNVWYTDDPALFGSSTEGWTKAGTIGWMGKCNFISNIIFGDAGHTMPLTSGGSATTYYGSTARVYAPDNGSLGIVGVGGFLWDNYYSLFGMHCGIAHDAEGQGVFGTRLCCLPEG